MGGAAAYYTYQNTNPVYQAEGAIWITTESREGRTSGPITEGGLLQASNWIQLLKSYAVLDPVVVEQRLYLGFAPADSAFFPDFGLMDQFSPGGYELSVAVDGSSYTLLNDQGIVVEAGSLGGPVGAALGFDWHPPKTAASPGQVVAFSVATPREAARGLAGNLNTSLDNNGNFIHLQLSGTNPSRATATLNAVMHQYIEVAADLKREKLDALTSILKEQLASSQEDLRAAEQSLEAFQVQTITLPSEETSPVVPGLQQTTNTVLSEFFSLRMEQEVLRLDRERLEAALSQARAGPLAVESFEMIPRVRESSELVRALGDLTEARAELRALRERYTDEYGPVAELIRQGPDAGICDHPEPG